MIIRFKKVHPCADTPKYAKDGDAAVDLTATGMWYDSEIDCWVYGTGLAVEIPRGYVGLIYPRSSLSKYDLTLANHVGVIDSGYRGEIILKFKPLKDAPVLYSVGDRIGQLIVQPVLKMDFVEVENLTDTNRGSGGFGSSGI